MVDLTELNMDYSIRVPMMVAGSDITNAIQDAADLEDSAIAKQIDTYGYGKLAANTNIVESAWAPQTADAYITALNNLRATLFNKDITGDYRLGLGASRPQARQIVTHGNIEVNGVKTDVASYLVKPGDVIAVRENRRDNTIIKANLEAGAARPVPEWLELDSKNLSAKVLRVVNREEIDLPVEEHLIVELYSK